MAGRLLVAISFDVEQWDAGSRAPAYEALLDTLAARPTTWFVTEDDTQSTVGRYPSILERARREGHEVAAHTHFQSADPKDMLRVVRRASEALRGHGFECLSYRAGAHVLHPDVADALVGLGYRYDSSAVPGLMRAHRLQDGRSVAAYPHVVDCRPFWWRPGLLELPTAAFPLRSPLAFLRQRFRLPTLLADPAAFLERARRLACTRAAPDVPVVVLGHSYDLERDGAPDPERLNALAHALDCLLGAPEVELMSIETLGRNIVDGRARVGLQSTLPGWVDRSALGVARAATRVLDAGRRLRIR